MRSRSQTNPRSSLVTPISPVFLLNFDSGDKPASPNLANIRKLIQPVQPPRKMFDLRLEQLECLFLFENPEVRERSGATQGIPCIAVPIKEGLLRGAEEPFEHTICCQ